jgi:hypothetical protein
MLTRTDLQQICLSRLEEAKILLAAGKPDAAAYIIGYVMETAFKARICKILDVDYPDTSEVGRVFKTHKYSELILLAGLQKEIDSKKTTSVKFKTNWSIVEFWNEAKRYEPIGSNSTAYVTTIITALEDPTDGILTWIKSLW